MLLKTAHRYKLYCLWGLRYNVSKYNCFLGINTIWVQVDTGPALSLSIGFGRNVNEGILEFVKHLLKSYFNSFNSVWKSVPCFPNVCYVPIVTRTIQLIPFLTQSDITRRLIHSTITRTWHGQTSYYRNIEGILPKAPYPPCLRMADRALLAGYPRYVPVYTWGGASALTSIMSKGSSWKLLVDNSLYIAIAASFQCCCNDPVMQPLHSTGPIKVWLPLNTVGSLEISFGDHKPKSQCFV